MSVKRRLKSARIFYALPAVFDLQPAFDYQSLVPRTTRELDELAWAMTASQFNSAIEEVKKSNPKLDLLSKQYRSSEAGEALFVHFSREFDALAQNVDQEQSRLREWSGQLVGGAADSFESDACGSKSWGPPLPA